MPSCEKDSNSQNSFAFGMLYGHSKKTITVKTIIRVDFLLIHLGFCQNFQIFRATEVCEK